MPTSRFAEPVRVARGAQWAASLLLIVVLLKSGLTTAAIPVLLRGLVVATAILAGVTPAAGLVAVALVAPLGYALAFGTIASWQNCPFDMPQAIVLAYFAGYMLSMRRRWTGPTRPPDPFAVPAAAFVGIVLASLIVQVRVLQVWHDYPLDYLSGLFRYLHAEYLVGLPDRRAWVDGRGCITVAAYLIEGVALMRCARVVVAARPQMWRPMALALAVVALIAAALAIRDPLLQARAAHVSVWTVLHSGRWATPLLPSVNTSGQFFMLLGFVTLGAALSARTAKPSSSTPATVLGVVRIVCAAGAVAAFTLMWITQTRSAIVAAIAATAAAALGAYMRRRGLSLSRTAVVTVAVAIVMIVAVTFINPFGLLARGADLSLRFRYRFAEVGLHMFSSAPITGVGVGQYESRFMDFASPDVLQLDARINNAHNYLLWMAAELGIVGLVAFVWLAGTALTESTRNVLRDPTIYRVAAYVGLVAFVITWSIAQPLNVQTVAFPFWLLLGAAAAPGGLVSMRTRAWGGAIPAAVAAAALVIVAVVTIPARAERAVQQVDLSRVSYGLYNTGETDDQHRFTWAGPHVRLFMRAAVPAVEMSVGSVPPLTPHGANVRVLVDEKTVQTLTLAAGEWRRIRVAPPSRSPGAKYWQIDIDIDPIDLPAGTPTYEHRIGIAAIERLPSPPGS